MERPDQTRPWWATLLSLFCAVTAVFLVARDIFVPHVRETEVWFGLEFHGWPAYVTAPVHWAIFVIAARGFWLLRPWVWPAASIYAFYIALSHLIWNVTSSSGEGWLAGFWQLGLFSVPAVILLWARPER